MSELLPNLVRFGGLLRALGIGAPAGTMIEVARALGHIDVGHREEFYCTLRALLVRRGADLPLFDRAFRAFWRPPRGERTQIDLRALGEERRFGKPQVEERSLSAAPEPHGSSESHEAAQRVELRTYSAREALRHKDFAKLTTEELEQARALLAELRWEPGLRRSRRWQAGTGSDPDLRRALRALLRSQGEAYALPSRGRKLRRRPIVLLCDVSGSMERYSRMLLQFAHVLQRGFQRVESFLFATRLTRITLQMRRRGSFANLSGLAPDWSGGTRIGEALRQFHLDWARRTLTHGAVVLLISDGWDRGDSAALAREMARLQRSCHRLIWLNPLLGSPEYQPLTRGMRAALPFVDDFLPVHDLASLESLAEHLATLPARRRRV